MQKSRQGILYFVLIYVITCWSGVSYSETQNELYTDECIETFETFAYTAYQTPSNQRITEPLPESAWQRVTSLPSEINQDFPIFNQVSITRMTNSYNEIWITGNGVGFAVYDTNHQTWKFISRIVSDTDYIIGNLFVSSDGAIWGQNTMSSSYQQSVESPSMPVLSRFNDTTNRFELVDTLLHVPKARGYHFPQPAFSDLPHILVDEQGMFWIIVSNDGIYQFNPPDETYKKLINLEFSIAHASLSTDGGLYLQRPFSPLSASPLMELYTLPQDFLWHFTMSTHSLASVDTPNEGWYIFHGMLVNQSNQLWLGATGYRSDDYNWHLVHPESFLDVVVGSRLGLVILITQTSDGRLWFVRYMDDGRDGTAWYNPLTREGCLMINHAVNIVEDIHQTLWMVAGRSLYKYSLNVHD